MIGVSPCGGGSVPQKPVFRAWGACYSGGISRPKGSGKAGVSGMMAICYKKRLEFLDVFCKVIMQNSVDNGEKM